ncbi:MAG: methionyl-tRNA formyltransferase, partial [Myxococcales bacterium]
LAWGLCAAFGDVVLLVCQLDRQKGRGQEVQPPPTKDWALRHGIPVRQPEKLKNTGFGEELKALAPDVAIVVAYGRILPTDVLAAPRRGCLNLHGSILPKYRGAAPIQWAVAEGEKETGICLMEMEAGLDTGPVIACETLPIGPDDTGGTMHDKLAKLGAEVLHRHLLPYLAGERTAVPQDHARATLAPILKKDDGRLDFSRPAAVLEPRIRGFTPWPGAWTMLDGKLLKVFRAEVGTGRGAPGEVLDSPDALEVACGEGSLRITELQLEGKKRMTAQQFRSGYRLPPGTRLS